MKFYKWVIFISTLFAAPPAAATLKDIHVEKLPQDSAVLKVYSDAGTVENFVRVWHDPWTFDTPRTKVSALLMTSLAELLKAKSSAPENEELQLLTGLIATYAYNVDIEGSHDIATDAFAEAHKLAPEDYRPDWFLGNLQCQTLELKQGMIRLLTIERSSPWDQLAVGFWDDYLFCASVTNMPAHALRAGAYIAKLNAPPSNDRNFLIETARKRFISPDPAKSYSSTEIWSAEQADSLVVLTNTMFGIQLSASNDWRGSLRDIEKEISTAQFGTGPHQGRNGGVTPNILVFIRAPKEGETETDFVKSLMPNSIPKSISVPFCPTQECAAFEVASTDIYKDEGGGHAIVVAFRRNSPEYPGLLFEEPGAPPSGGAGKTTYTHPTERIRRLAGTLYYFVLLDTADSVLTEAKSDYETFLKSIHVE